MNGYLAKSRSIYNRSKKSDLVFTRGVTVLRHGPAIDQLKGAALQEHFGRGEWRTYHVLQRHAFAEVGDKGP